ncbi:translation initiation factor IF-3 [Candidatus Bipolaricaulota bacterium]|nr:translation initiation factor IF-3 [Candidatus Bipolaricaulota bacterium]
MKRAFRINEQIQAKEVLLIDSDGRNLGVVPREKALALARERGLDLVEVAPEANPVVCKIVDFGKYRYQLQKREKKQPKAGKVKEVKFTIQTGEHDFRTKVQRIREFLEEGMKVRAVVFFKGRQIIHMEKGKELLARVAELTQDLAKVEQDATERGRNLEIVLAPISRKGGGS